MCATLPHHLVGSAPGRPLVVTLLADFYGDGPIEAGLPGDTEDAAEARAAWSTLLDVYPALSKGESWPSATFGEVLRGHRSKT